ncbi:MAG: ATP-grasp domain-containing protein [Candidatus Pacebacteria bacterium]|nr:ATP-grasp domain-containing protein [Candidatus Paceibacterota bacterium]
MKRILVTAASSLIGNGIVRSLRKSADKNFLIGSVIDEDTIASAFCDLVVLAPRSDDPTYMDWLLAEIKSRQISVLFAGISDDHNLWNDHRSDLQRAGVTVVLNDQRLISLCQDKWQFYREIKDITDCAIPSSLDNDYDHLVKSFGLPFLLKPRRGHGSKGIVRIESYEEFVPLQSQMGGVLMAQPIVGLDDQEYTVSVFGDGQGGYCGLMSLRRRLSKDGFTAKAEVVDDDEFLPSIIQLCRHFKPIGPTNFQFRLEASGPRLLEINPRISSATSIRTAFGYNESLMALDYFCHGILPSQPLIRRGKAIRFTEDFIFYETGHNL